MIVQLAVATGLPPRELELWEWDDLATLVDVLDEQTRKRRRGR